MAINFDIRTGTVFLRNFDLGVVETLGGYLTDITQLPLSTSNGTTIDGSQLVSSQICARKNYVIDIPLANPTQVPVIFNRPLPLYSDRFYPSFVILRGDASPDLARWHSVGAMQYRVPSDDATFQAVILANGDVVSGYDKYEELPQAWPFNIPYTINMYARYEYEAIAMLKKVLSVFKPYSKVDIKDSFCTDRSYTVFNENGFSDISEVADIVDRVKAYSVEIRIEGELDLSEPEINDTVLEIISRTQVIE